MEKKIKEQDQKIIKITKLSVEKEAKFAQSVLDYQKQISKLQAELDISHTAISNLKEQREKTIITTQAIQTENAKLKKHNEEVLAYKNKIEKDLKEITSQFKEKNSKKETDTKKYEEQIKSLRKAISSISQKKNEIEEIIMKQEATVTHLSKKSEGIENALKDKNKQLQDNIEYTAKLTSMLNSNKQELIKLKQNNINPEQLANLQKELECLKKEIAVKNNKINLLSMNNKILQNKILKQSHVPSLSNGLIGIKSVSEKIEVPQMEKDCRNNIIQGKIKPRSQQQHKSIEKRIIHHNNKTVRKNYSVKKEEKKQKEYDNLYQEAKPEKIVIVAKQKVKSKNEFDICNAFEFDGDLKNAFGDISNIEHNDNEKHSINDIKEDNLKLQKDTTQQLNKSLEVEFPIIESYCVLNPDNSSNLRKDNNDEEEEDEGIDVNEVAKLHNCVNKILNEFE